MCQMGTQTRSMILIFELSVSRGQVIVHLSCGLISYMKFVNLKVETVNSAIL